MADTKGDTTPVPIDPISLLKGTQIDVLGRPGTIVVMVVVMIAGLAAVAAALLFWNGAETLSTSTSSISVETSGSDTTVICSGAISVTKDGTPPNGVAAAYPTPCPTVTIPPQSQAAGSGAGTTSSTSTNASPSPQNANATPSPQSTNGAAAGSSSAGQAESGGTPPADNAAVSAFVPPTSAEGAPTTVSKRSSNFFLYLLLMGGGALLVGAFLPRIQSIKLGGAEVEFGSALPASVYLKILAEIHKKANADPTKTSEDKAKAIKKLDSIASPKPVRMRAIGKPPRAGLFSRATDQTAVLHTHSFEEAPTVMDFAMAREVESSMAEPDYAAIADHLLEQ